MKPRDEPVTDPPAPDWAKVRAILEEANVLREAGVNLHCHEVLERLEEASGHPLAYLVFAFTCGGAELSSAELEAFTDGLTGVHPCDPYGHAHPRPPE